MMGSDDLRKKLIDKNRECRIARKTIKRNNRHLSAIPRILILTEGYSEKIYFAALRNMLSLNTVEIMKSKHTDSVGIVKEAIQLAENSQKNSNDYDYIFCIFDLDTVKNLKFIGEIHKYESAQDKKEYIKIFPIYTFPCIEIWFILHFTICCKPFGSQGNRSIGDTAKNFLTKNYASDYSETNRNCIISFVDRYEQALINSIQLIENQKQIESINPICTVHKLVKLLKNINQRDTNGYIFERVDQEESFIESYIKK